MDVGRARRWAYSVFVMMRKPLTIRSCTAAVLFCFLLTIAFVETEAQQPTAAIIAPRPVYHPDPEYSFEARRAHLQGTCVLRVHVDPDGAVRDVRVERSLGMGLDEESVKAVRTWRFEPALQNGHPTAAEIEIQTTFRLGNGDGLGDFPDAMRPLELPIARTIAVCPQISSHREQPPKPKTTIADLHFDGMLEVPVTEQDEIAGSIKQRVYEGPLELVKNQVFELVREAWMDRGYINVQVAGDSNILASNSMGAVIGLAVRVEEGQQYRLAYIRFLNNKVIANEKALRDLFPIRDGEVFNRTRVAEGLEKLRNAYATQGYINFTSVPTPTTDESGNLVSLDVDMDEGKQFVVSGIDLVAQDEQTLTQASNDLLLKVGHVYNQHLINLFSRKYPLNSSKSSLSGRNLDERKGTVSITLDLRRCQ
jgi:TonB family protein